MKKLFIIILAAAAVFTLPACKKKKGCKDPLSIKFDSEAEEDDGSCTYAGTGGNVTMVVYLKHHGEIIPNQTNYPDTVFLKFNAKDGSSTSYDALFAGEVGEDHVHIPGMKPGYYFVRGVGLDSTDVVRGGIAVTITQTSGEVEVSVPVTE